MRGTIEVVGGSESTSHSNLTPTAKISEISSLLKNSSSSKKAFEYSRSRAGSNNVALK